MAIYLRGQTIGGIALAGARPTQTKTVEPTTEEQVILPDEGYQLSEVVVNAVDPEDYYKPESEITVTPTAQEQEILPEEGEVFNKVIVEAENLGTKNITSNGTYVASADNLDGFSSVTVNVSNFFKVHIAATVSGNKQTLAITDYNGEQADNYMLGVIETGNTQEFFIVDIDSEIDYRRVFGQPLSASTDAEMAALLVAENINKIVYFTGTSQVYETNTYYFIGE